MKEESKVVLPSFTELIVLQSEKEDGKCVYDFAKLRDVLTKIVNEIESIDIFYNNQTCQLKNLPENANQNDL